MGFLNWLRQRTEKKSPKRKVSRKNAPSAVVTARNVEMTPNEQVVALYLQSVNSHEIPTQGIHQNADFVFKEAPMTFDGFQDEMFRIYESLPDFKINVVGPIKEQPDGVVTATVYATGTHTGKPYSFGPFPPIEPTGAAITLDSEYVFTICKAQNSPTFMPLEESVTTQSATEK